MNQRLRKNLLNALTAFMIIAPILLVGSIIFVSVYEGSTKEITAVADQLKPDADWGQAKSSVNPPRLLCLGDVTCPYLSRSWTIQKPLSGADFISQVKQSGWTFKTEYDCGADNILNSGSPGTICEARGTKDGYDFIVSLSGTSDKPQERNITLSLEPKEE